MKTFAELFKKYRLRAEFDTFSAFGDALSQKGYHYEESIYSHWQKGTRTPTNRRVILAIIELFVENNAITTKDEANDFIASTGMGFLTQKELEQFSLLLDKVMLFQVPSEITDFSGRDDLIKLFSENELQGKVVHIYGLPGVGKTTLAIKIAHMQRDNFSDGIFWYRIGNASLREVLLSIIHLLGVSVPSTKSAEVLASCIRLLLSQKKILLILDNVDKNSNIHLLLPISGSSSMMILSRHKNLYIPAKKVEIFLESFNQNEALTLFKNVLGQDYVKKHRLGLLRLIDAVGRLPLAINIFAKQLLQKKVTPKELLKAAQREESSLTSLYYEDSNLFAAIQVSYKNLSESAQNVFLSLGMFEQKDFSVEVIAFMNGIAPEKAERILQELHNASLIETSLQNKYRIHPIIKKFIGEKINHPHMSVIVNTSVALFGFFTLFWLIIQTKMLSWNFNVIFGATYFIVPLWGSLWGFTIAKKWGGMNSIMGKVFSLFSLGLFFQALGQVIYAVYNQILKIEIPYPSLGDIGYFGSMLFYLSGIFLISKISGVKLGVYLFRKYLPTSILFCCIFLSICFLLFNNYIFNWSEGLKIFLDLTYPFVDSASLFISIILFLELRRNNKNVMKNKIMFFVIALFAQFLSDFVFIYQANLATWRVGQINDYMYLSSYLLMTLAIMKLNSHVNRLVIK